MCANKGTRDTRQKQNRKSQCPRTCTVLQPLCEVLFRICADARKEVADEALLQLVREQLDHLEFGIIVSGR